MLTTEQVRTRLAAQMAEAGGATAWGRVHRVSPSYLGDVVKGRREPGAAVLRPLGLVRLEHAYDEAPSQVARS
ncbi:transcriptional regulator [Methylobacterium sp. BTF04]|uniref:transcriptional regulator n=1 Tax=Methylobacterium sp. BTF04 TaxID=2708300 RepID=UPI0013D61354|nr:transcriptional regulator [Methylobacterium sp. BTF04]NEU12607.1 transcriptional regulator [Methylobacterium sp. BTF04]